MKIRAIYRNQLAQSDQEYLALLASDADWIARSAADVEALRAANEGPFAKLAEADYYEFLNSLKFYQGGLVTANYKPLMKALTLAEIFDAFGRFGLGEKLVLQEDHIDYWCPVAGGHNCARLNGWICMGTC